MTFFLAGFGLLLHVLFWGAGLALLLTPRPWKRYWPVFMGPVGLALQSAVVWAGAHTDLPGTDSYAWSCEWLPVALLAGALWRTKDRGWSRLGGEMAKLNALWLVMAVVLNALLIPMAVASKVLTTSSLGSCDAADYAAGARVFQEFARSDRSGFLGLAEVVRVGSVDNFFDYWTRLNHFTPSALVAFNDSLFGLAPHELLGVATAVFVALTLPAVFWLARAGLRLGAGAAVVVALIYGASPLVWYGVFHVAMSQILAAQAIALLTWCGQALWQRGASWRTGFALSGLMAVAYALIWGAYNFIIVVALVPAVAYAGGLAFWKGRWAQLGRWCVLMMAPAVATGIFFAGRVAGLAERFQLFRQFDFGWKIPGLTPEGLLGMVNDTALNGHALWLRWVLAGGVALVLCLALLRGVRARDRRVWAVLCFTGPILVGYVFLLVRANLLGTNASYDAYKLIAVFYPGILAAGCYWLRLGRVPHLSLRVSVTALALIVLGFNFNGASRFAKRMQSPPLMVDPALAQVQRVEAMPMVQSVNMLVTDMWSRLWANAFLLRKPQYFRAHTYEGRLNTGLKGEWDLLSGVVSISLPDDGGDFPDKLEVAAATPLPSSSTEARLTAPKRPTPMGAFALIDTRSPYFLRARMGDGWYDAERMPRAGPRWRWSRGDANLIVDNPQARPLKVALRLRVRSLVNRDLQIWTGDRHWRTVQVGTSLMPVSVPAILIPPGQTILEFRSAVPPLAPGGADTRLLGFAAYGIELEVRPDSEELKP